MEDPSVPDFGVLATRSHTNGSRGAAAATRAIATKSLAAVGASAAIESANKRLVGRRCKQGGLIWNEPGLEAMVALRVAFYNRDTWRRLWPHSAPSAAV